MTKAHEEIITFIASGTTSQSILAFVPSPEAKARVDGLIQKKKADSLSPDEASELEDYLELEHLMRMTKAKARTLQCSE
jgi:hypothetical protein